MNTIFLTSQANKVLKGIVPLLPKQPSEYKVVFIPTGAALYTDAPWMHADRDELVRLGFIVNDLGLDTASPEEVASATQDADIIFVAGGNTFYLLEHARRTRFDVAVKEAVSAGKIYIGSSAGAVLAGPDISYVASFDDPEKASLENTKGLGLVNFSVIPHAGNSKYKELHDAVLIEYKDWDYPLVLVSDNQFVVPIREGWEIMDV
ncbi:MAG: Type 1 glutamine amidotransferase-like domain-containing protein [Patescibacteria group bacterium]